MLYYSTRRGGCMQLKISVGKYNNETRCIFFDIDSVHLSVGCVEDIYELFSDEYIKEEMETREETIEYATGVVNKEIPLDNVCDDEEEEKRYREICELDIIEDKKRIENIEKFKEAPCKLKYFDDYTITFEKETSIRPFLEFMSALNNLTIGVDNLAKEEIDLIKETEFAFEPWIACKYNTEDITLSEYVETIDVIETSADIVKKHKLSPLEKIMLAYDILKEQQYSKETNGNPAESRDLTKVLKGDKIVCGGYANVFSATLNELGINAEIKVYAGRVRGHATVVAHISDPKYDFTGIMEFDPTWDSKKENNPDWVNKYDHFCTNNNLTTIKKLKDELIDQTYNSIDYSYKYYEKGLAQHIDPFTRDNVKKLFKKIVKRCELLKLDKKAEELKRRIDNLDKYIPYFEEVKVVYEEIESYLDIDLTEEQFTEILYTTRRIEHAIDPIKYPLDLEIIERIVHKRFLKAPEDRIYSFLQNWDLEELFFGPDVPKVVENIPIISNTPNDEDPYEMVSCDAKRMELIHVLRKIKTKKMNR